MRAHLRDRDNKNVDSISSMEAWPEPRFIRVEASFAECSGFLGFFLLYTRVGEF